MIALLWLTAIGLLAAATRLPRVTDIYFHDFYIVVPRPSLIGLILVVLVLPLSVVTVKRMPSIYR